MKQEMLAVVNYGPKNYKLEKIKKPIPAAKELLVKVEACGICGSDVHCFEGAGQYWDGPDPWVKTPVVPGHEFVGFVEDGSSEALEYFAVEIGDRVIAEQIIPCGKCMFCQTGKYWMCQVHNIFGFQKQEADGAMAEYMIFNERCRVHKVPKELSLENAAYIEPLACGLHVVERSNLNFRDTVVVSGAGPLGLGMIQAFRLKTPKRLVVLDLNEDRLQLARSLGADVALNPTTVNVVEEVKKMTGGYGTDIYVEATGSPPSVGQGLAMVRRLGTFIEFSVFNGKANVDWSVIGDQKELNLLGSHLGPYCYPVAIDLLARNKISAQKIVTHQYPLKEFDAAFKMAKSAASIKVLLRP